MNVEHLENVKKKTTKCIPSYNEDHKDRLRTLNLLHISQYMELHGLMMFIDIINNKSGYHLLVHGKEHSFKRQGVRGELPLEKNCLTKTNNEFLRRTKTLYNHVFRKLREAIATNALMTDIYWN